MYHWVLGWQLKIEKTKHVATVILVLQPGDLVLKWSTDKKSQRILLILHTIIKIKKLMEKIKRTHQNGRTMVLFGSRMFPKKSQLEILENENFVSDKAVFREWGLQKWLNYSALNHEWLSPLKDLWLRRSFRGNEVRRGDLYLGQTGQ